MRALGKAGILERRNDFAASFPLFRSAEFVLVLAALFDRAFRGILYAQDLQDAQDGKRPERGCFRSIVVILLWPERDVLQARARHEIFLVSWCET